MLSKEKVRELEQRLATLKAVREDEEYIDKVAAVKRGTRGGKNSMPENAEVKQT